MSFRGAIQRAYQSVRDHSVLVEPTRWQSVDVSKKPEAATYEVLDFTMKAMVPTEDLGQLRGEIEPNLPWADDHFLERVGGSFNPGETWRTWPWANKADTFRTAGGGKYSHTYGERYWPKQAWRDELDILKPVSTDPIQHAADSIACGIRYAYGDLTDVVEHLYKAPQSRQAYLPIWFPEDTGKLDVRVPCTLGYHFIMRHDFLHCIYYIRSCDLYRHFRDDVYLTVRLQLWILDQLRERSASWNSVRPGKFTMHITSLHLFVNDAQLLWPGFRR